MFSSLIIWSAIFAVSASLWVSVAGAQTWMHYGGDAGGSRFSGMTQIDRENVGDLELAWQYRTGAIEANPKLKMFLDFQATPILLPSEAGGHLMVCDPFSKVIALDPATGEERWVFDPEVDKRPYAGRFKCRGIEQWQDPLARPDAVCAYRLFMPTPDRRLIALDARTGEMCQDFGEEGTVNVDPIIREMVPSGTGVIGTQLLSPPTVVSGLVVVTTTSNKFKSIYSVNGSIMAFNARNGKLVWTFDPLVRDAATGFEPTPQEIGGGNVWVPMAVDQERDLLFVPTASPAPNFWGAHRPGDNRHANSIVALKGSTGEFVWAFQVVHHDIWDKDNPAQPILADITKDGETIPAVIQLTKAGMAFAFHRETGESLFPIEERPVPAEAAVPGEQPSPTQPFTVKPPPLVRQTLSPDDAWGFTVVDRNYCRQRIEELNHGSMYTPPSTKGTIMYPQVGGGSNWGGGAFDPQRNILITPVSQIPYFVRMVPNDEIDPATGKLPQAGAPMQVAGYIKGAPYGIEQGPLMSPSFSPCTAPPWNMLVAVDMAAGEIKWKVPFGRLDKLMPVPIPLNWGTPSAGGPIVTASGLIFIGATADSRLHAYDIDTGEELWEFKAPTMAAATPMTYEYEGRQYVVFAVGGHAWYYAKGVDDYLLAFALPE
jgi:quinoprotein glucose dehydrogenase